MKIQRKKKMMNIICTKVLFDNMYMGKKRNFKKQDKKKKNSRKNFEKGKENENLSVNLI